MATLPLRPHPDAALLYPYRSRPVYGYFSKDIRPSHIALSCADALLSLTEQFSKAVTEENSLPRHQDSFKKGFAGAFSVFTHNIPPPTLGYIEVPSKSRLEEAACDIQQQTEVNDLEALFRPL
jgi:hypothetical protein